MTRILGLVVIALMSVGCQKAAETTRIGSGGSTPQQLADATGMQWNGIVVNQSISQSNFNDIVRDYMEWALDGNDVGTVSATGGDSGMFAGGRLERADGQAINIGNGRSDLTTTSQLMLAVVDKFSGSTSVAALPGRLFSQSNGYVSGNHLYVKFSDKYGWILLDGTFDQNVAVLDISFNNQVDYTGHQGATGTLGQLRIPTCQFFRCR